MLASDTTMIPTTRLAGAVPTEPVPRKSPGNHRTFGQFVEEDTNQDTQEIDTKDHTGLESGAPQDAPDGRTETSGREHLTNGTPGAAKGHAVDSERPDPDSDDFAEKSGDPKPPDLQSVSAASCTRIAPPNHAPAADLPGQAAAEGAGGLDILASASPIRPPESPGAGGRNESASAAPHSSGGKLTAGPDAATGFARHSRANDPSFTIFEMGVELGKEKNTPPEAANGEPRGFSVGQQGLWPAPQPRDNPIRPIHAATELRALRPHAEPDAAVGPLGIGAEFSAGQNAEAPVGLLVTHAPDRAYPQTPAATYPEVIRSVARQMSAAIAVRPEAGGADIALNPVELGRVSMALRAGEDAVLLSIATERPETLELMKRHIADLTAEFQELGYSDISFEFQTMADDGGGHSGFADHPPAGEMMDTAEPTPEIRTSSGNPSTGIDMRL